MKKVRRYQNGGSTYSRDIVNKAFTQYPILNTIGTPDKFNVIAATGKDQQHLNTMGRRLEYFSPNEDWYPLYDDTTQKQPIPYKGTYRTMIDTTKQTPQQVQDAVGLDFVSHALHNNPQYQQFNDQLNTQLVNKYGQRMVQGNGGADAYIRGHLSNSPEYQPYKDEMKFLPGNYFTPLDSMIQRKQHGGYSTQGYKSNSPDRFNPYNVIPSGRITMNNVPHPVMGIDDMGNRQLMQPGGEYQFPGNRVFEVPLKGNDMNKKKLMKNGGSNMYWNGTKWVSAGNDSGTYNNGVYYATGGPTYPNPGAAPLFANGGSASFDITGNGYPTPFAMYPGTGNRGGALQDLPTTMQTGGYATNDASYVNPFAMWAGSGQGGGALQDLPTEMKKGGHWIPKHMKKGRCTPAPNPDCPVGSPQYNLAMTFKKHHGFHQMGGNTNSHHPLAKFQHGGGDFPDMTIQNTQNMYTNPDDFMAQGYQQRDNTQDVIMSNPDIYGNQPMATSDTMTPGGNGTNPNYWQQVGQQPQGNRMTNGNPLSAWGNAVFGAGMLGLADASIFSDINRQKEDRLRNTRRGLSENSVGVYNPQGGHGDYTNNGMFRPDQRVPTRAGYFPSAMHSNGYMQHGGYTNGQELEMSDEEMNNLRRMGYQFEML